MIEKKITPVILCGGQGTRLWPLSRSSLPKQYISLSKNKNRSLLQNTYLRISNFDYVDDPILICNEENRFIAAEQIREINVKPQAILLEPFGKGTAPAIALAALRVLQIKLDTILLVLSCDHEIIDNTKFLESIRIGLEYAKNGRLVTFGVSPHEPSTAYGYIKSEKSLNLNKASNIESFKEKPNLETAKEFIQDKCFSWNSGIFLFNPEVLINEFKKFAPLTLDICKKVLENSREDLDFQRLNKALFSNLEETSIDVAIMEKTKLGTVVSLNAGWRDLGSWNEVWESLDKDENGNVNIGNIVLRNCSNSFFKSEDRLVVGVGVENLVVIETADALLVLNRENSQDIKEIVNYLNKINSSEAKEHKIIYRPWGSYECLYEESTWKVKKIIVKPKQSLSLQKHNHRSEHWVVLKGVASVEINGEKSKVYENQSTYIPLGIKHRLSNKEDFPLIIVEVQSGESVEENDIVRFEDKYGRTSDF